MGDRRIMPARDRCSRVVRFALLGLVVVFASSTSVRPSEASKVPVTQYVLSSPHSTCRPHYVKRTLTMTRRVQTNINGTWTTTVEKVRVVGCVLVTSPLRSSPPLYGLTLDSVARLNAVMTTLRALPEHATVRVTFDAGEPAHSYSNAVSELSSVAAVMGELLDSSDVASISTTAFQARVEDYLATLNSSVAIWEIGNEVNGSWAGSYADAAARISAAYDDVAAVRAKSALTLYANEYAPNHCGDGVSELTPVAFSTTYVAKAVRDGISYVFESYYPTRCDDTYPSSAAVRAEMKQLHSLYPNALVGFGEVGLPARVSAASLPTAERVMSWAYRLNPRLSYYVGGYFWWHGAEDLVPASKPLVSQFLTALSAEAKLLY